jgi:hypothetical protein
VTLNLFIELFVASLAPPKWKSHVSLSFFAGFMIPAIAVVTLSQRKRSKVGCPANETSDI